MDIYKILEKRRYETFSTLIGYSILHILLISVQIAIAVMSLTRNNLFLCVLASLATFAAIIQFVIDCICIYEKIRYKNTKDL